MPRWRQASPRTSGLKDQVPGIRYQVSGIRNLDSDSRSRWRRACTGLAVVATAWSLLTSITGGIALPLFSSRNPRNPALFAALMFGVAWWLADPGARRQQIRLDLLWLGAAVRSGLMRTVSGWARLTRWLEISAPRAAAPLCVMTIVGAVVITAITHAPFVAAGSDAWGYVSQAHMWATWTLRVPEPLLDQLNGVLPRDAMAPLAYRPSPEGATIVPVTSPGLPMLMAAFEVVGGPSAVFAVVPMLAGLVVWATYRLGSELDGPWTGVLAAMLMAASPAFLFQLTSAPMSDIAATAFWTLSLTAALRRQAGWSGACAAIAILIRANLAPLAIVPGAMLLARSGSVSHAQWARTRAVPQFLAFAAPVVLAAVFIASLYTYWYGSPLRSGYGTVGQLFSVANLSPNLARYSAWILESQTAVILGALVAPALVVERRAALGILAFAAATLGCYVFYLPFDAWWFLRFLLPAFPGILALTAASLVRVSRWFPQPSRVPVVALVLFAVVHHSITYAAARATFDSGGEQKYARTGEYVAAHLPENAVVFSEIHSGSIRYYAQRPTIRFSLVPADHLEGAVGELTRLGYRPYLVAEDWEEAVFRQQFAGRSIMAMLDAGPDVEMPLGHVRVYPLAR